MERDFACPVCDAERWEAVERYRYRRRDRRVLGAPLNEYELLRRRVLFEVWAPEVDELRLTLLLCGECGFVCYSPRPTPAERAAGHRFLGRASAGAAAAPGEPGAVELDARRARRTLAAIEGELGGLDGLRVLDFGGGDGKLMAPFVEAGAECELADYTAPTQPGVRKVADTLDDLSPSPVYDVIVASHVVEHLVDPRETVVRLHSLLRPGGILYVEVPDQVWKGVPIAADPVTHVNFFHLPSLVLLLHRARLDVRKAERRRSSYGARELDVLVALAAADGAGPRVHPGKGGAAAARRLLRPTVAMEARHVLRERRLPHARGLLRRLGARGPVQ